MKIADLHTHSYYSDGEFSPTEIVKRAKERGIKILALTDHSSVGGIEEAIKEGTKNGIQIIPAVEFISKEAEVLGYFIDYKDKKLKLHLKKSVAKQNDKTKKKIKKLQKEGFDITLKKLKNIFPKSKGNYNSAHIAYYLNKQLKIPPTKSFEIIGKIKTQSNMPETNIIKVIKIIVKNGGVPILAHPWIYPQTLEEKNIKKYILAGLKGIEIENGDENKSGRTKKIINQIKKIARENKLILTSGSDYHGPIMVDILKTHNLGDYNCDNKIVEKLKSKIKKK